MTAVGASRSGSFGSIRKQSSTQYVHVLLGQPHSTFCRRESKTVKLELHFHKGAFVLSGTSALKFPRRLW